MNYDVVITSSGEVTLVKKQATGTWYTLATFHNNGLLPLDRTIDEAKKIRDLLNEED